MTAAMGSDSCGGCLRLQTGCREGNGVSRGSALCAFTRKPNINRSAKRKDCNFFTNLIYCVLTERQSCVNDSLWHRNI